MVSDLKMLTKKKRNPLERSCFLSKLFFCWTFPTFLKGFKKKFTESDLFPPLKEHEAASLGQKLEEAWAQECFKHAEPSLWNVLIKIFGKQFLKFGCLILFNETIKLLQPLSMYMLMTSFSNKKKFLDLYIYTASLLLSIFCNVMCQHQYYFGLQKLGLKVKIACSSLIYRKSLKLSKGAVNKSTNGQIVNFLSNDLNRFDKLFVHLHYIWIAPIEACVIMYLLYAVLNPSGMVGIALYFMFVPLQMFIGMKYSEFRLKTAKKTDERVRLVNEIISGIQVIKMYTWEDLFIKLVNTARREEIRYVSATSYLKAFQKCFNRFLSKGAVFLCILMFVLTGNKMQPQYVFVIKSFYIIIKESMTTFFPEAIKNVAEALVSVRRIENFLANEEIFIPPTKSGGGQAGILLTNVSAQWVQSTTTLEEVNFSVYPEQLVIVVGTVGSGKSSLISVILKELPVVKGKLEVSGTVSYAAQESWLFAGTVRENILFGQPMNHVKYKEVIKSCALDLDFDNLPNGDFSIIGDRGITLSGGQKSRINLARAIYRDADIYLLDDPLSALDASVAKQIFNSCLLNYLKNKCVVLLTHQLQFLEKADFIYFLRNGKVVISGDYDHVRQSDEDFAMLLKEEFEHEDLDTVSDEFTKELSLSYEEVDEKKQKESQQFGEVSGEAYKKYLFSGGCVFSVIFILLGVTQILQSSVDYFEAYWVDLQQNKTEDSLVHKIFPFVGLENCLYIYSVLMLVILIFTIITSISFYAYFTSASIKLHHNMFSAMIKGVITFFYSHPSGVILNRFSKDIASIDMNIPKYLQDTLQSGLEMIAIVTIISFINPWMALVSATLFFIFYVMRRFYLTTSRELKRIECITRSPVYSHLNQTLQGLETIRAFGAEERLRRQFDNYLNRNISAFYMFLGGSSTFGFWLDVACVGYITAVTSTYFWYGDISGADVGLIITQSMGLTNMLQWGMMQWSEFENEMTSVERVLEYTEIEPETEFENQESADFEWKGSDVDFQSVSLKYKDDGPCVLNCVDFKIEPKEKIGVVGRTGAGKSSIISALFRLIKFDGKISIGGININKLPLKMSRSKISIIPQEPVLFSGTVRENLDPYSEYQDSKLWQILEELDLKSFVGNLPEGLESKISENGSNLSVGQKQLFCLARALLRENKILVLDEATANVDFKTDALIQSTIKKKFSDCSVLIIAHRLHTIIDCDKILVMDCGRVIEFDHPYKLLENEEGALYNLVLKTGKIMKEYLKEIAAQNYMSSRSRVS